MNERERLLAVLNGDVPDEIPWYADLSYLYQSMQKKAVLEERYLGEEGYLRFHEELGAGICFYAPLVWKMEYGHKVQHFDTIEDGDIVSTFITPQGEICQVQRYLPKTYAWAITEHFIKDINDLKVMLYVYEHATYEENYREFERIDRMWGGNGIAVALAPISVSPLQKLLTRWAGVEKTIEMLMDYENQFDDIIERLKNSEDQVFSIISESPAELVEFAENLSSEITGRNIFAKYSSDYYTKRINQLHSSGKLVSIHIDGTLKGCFDLLEKTGFDAAEAVTPWPMGDIAVDSLRKVAGEKIVIWGGLPGALFSPLFSDREFEEHLQHTLEAFSRGSKFVLGVADQVPPDGLISRVKRVREVIG